MTDNILTLIIAAICLICGGFGWYKLEDIMGLAIGLIIGLDIVVVLLSTLKALGVIL